MEPLGNEPATGSVSVAELTLEPSAPIAALAGPQAFVASLPQGAHCVTRE